MITDYKNLFSHVVKQTFLIMSISQNISFELAIDICQYLVFSSTVNLFSGEDKILIKQEINKNKYFSLN